MSVLNETLFKGNLLNFCFSLSRWGLIADKKFPKEEAGYLLFFPKPTFDNIFSAQSLLACSIISAEKL